MLWIVENTLIAALLALIVVLISRTARLTPVVRHGLWLVVLVKLITPPIFSVALPIPAACREFVSLERPARGTGFESRPADTGDRVEQAGNHDDPAPQKSPLPPSPLAGEGPGVRGPGATSNDALPPIDAPFEFVAGTLDPVNAGRDANVPQANSESLVATNAAERSAAAGTKSRFSLSSLGEIATQFGNGMFIAGTCLVIIVQALRLVRLRRLLRSAAAAPRELTAMVKELSAEMRIAPPAVRVAPIGSPILCAWGRAVLIWPASGLPALRGAARCGVIVHELAHLARRDHWIGWLELVAGCAWWWNPLFWYVRHQLHENAELACDAWAAGLFPAGKGDYARALVALAEQESFPMATVPALGVGRGSRKLFERRLVMILGDRVRYQLGTVGLIGVGLLGLVALVGCSASLAGDETAPVTAVGLDEPPVVLETVDSKAVPAATAEPVFDYGVQPGVGERFTVEVAFPPTEPAPPSNEDRLKRLEDKFDALLSELREARSSPSATPAKGVKEAPAGLGWTKKPVPAAVAEPKAVPADKAYPSAVQNYYYHTDRVEKVAKGKRAPDHQDSESVALTRATYKLPPGKADEIAAFLKAHLTDDVDVRVKDGALQITATSEDQTAIAQFVRLLHARGTPTPRKASIRLNGSPGTLPVGPSGFPGALPGTAAGPGRVEDTTNFPAPIDPTRNEKSATPPSNDNLPAPGASPAELPRPEKSATPRSSESTLEPFPVPEKRQ